MFWLLVTPTGKTTDAIAMKFFPDTILLLHMHIIIMVLKDIQVGIKLIRRWTIIQIAVNSSKFKKICANVAKDDLQYLVTPTS